MNIMKTIFYKRNTKLILTDNFLCSTPWKGKFWRRYAAWPGTVMLQAHACVFIFNKSLIPERWANKRRTVRAISEGSKVKADRGRIVSVLSQVFRVFLYFTCLCLVGNYWHVSRRKVSGKSAWRNYSPCVLRNQSIVDKV